MLKAKQVELHGLKAELKKQEKEKKEANQELDQAARREKGLNDRIAQTQAEMEEVKEMQTKQDKAMREARVTIEQLLEKHKWIEAEKEYFGVAGHKYHFEKVNMVKVRESVKMIGEENDKMKNRINFKVDTMYDKVEAQFQEL